MDKRSPITDRLDWVRFSKSVETCEQAYALTTGKFGFGRAPAFEIRHKSQSPNSAFMACASRNSLSLVDQAPAGRTSQNFGGGGSSVGDQAPCFAVRSPALLATALSATLKKNFP
jgi:hypothetical protein